MALTRQALVPPREKGLQKAGATCLHTVTRPRGPAGITVFTPHRQGSDHKTKHPGSYLQWVISQDSVYERIYVESCRRMVYMNLFAKEK